MRLHAAVLVVACAAPALAQEHVLFEVQGKDVLSGTIRPADETEAVLCRMARGSVLKAAVKSIDKAGPVPTLELLLDGAPVDGALVSPKGRGAVLAPIAVGKTGLYKLVVRGDGDLDGDYQVSLAWKPQKTFSGSGTTGADQTFAFAAPRDAKVSVKLGPAKGSPFLPNLIALEGPDPGDHVALAGGGAATGVPLTRAGEWRVRFSNAGQVGPYAISVKVSAPSPKKHTFDLRDGTLAGAFGGGNTVVGAVVDAGLGGLVEVTDPGSPIAGSSVSVPPGSLGQTTSLFVAEAKPYVPPGGDLPAGPAVEFGPEGTQFDASVPATVTIPYDPEAFPGGTSALVVYVKSADGTIEPVLPTSSYVFGANTVTFTTSHFSVFQAATSAPRGPPSGDFWYGRVEGGPTTAFGGATGVTSGVAFLGEGSIQWFTSGSALNLVSGLNPDGNQPPTVEQEGTGADVLGDMTQVDDSTFDVAAIGKGPPIGRLRRDVTGDVLVLEHVEGFGLGATLMLRRADERPTMNAISGRWNVVVWEAAATTNEARADTLPVSLLAETGTVTIDPAGVAVFKMTGGVKRSTDYPGGTWRSETVAKRSATGTMTIGSDAFPELSFATEDVIGFTVCLGGDVLAARMDRNDRGFGRGDLQCGLLFLVREASRLSLGEIAGTYVDVLGASDLRGPADADPNDPIGIRWRANSGSDRFEAGAFGSSFVECFAGYPSDGGAPLTSSAPVELPGTTKFGVTPAGVFSVPSFSVTGAARTGGGLVIYLIRDPRTHGLGFKIRVAPPPP